MLIEVLTGFLALSLFLYCVLAGADFGAGILEIFVRGKSAPAQREVISRAMAPVWEANHVWIILAIVILLMGFPQAYSRISIYFHIPLTLMLMGIILRGCAFTFRHYDAVRDGSQRYYSWIFQISSVITPLLLGTIAGALLLGRRPEGQDYAAQFVWPWLNIFCVSVGIFTCSLFAFVAAVYLLGETPSIELRRVFVGRARAANGAAVVAGLAVFGAAEVLGFPLLSRFFNSAWSVAALAIATALLFPLWLSIRRELTLASRILVATQVGLVLLGWIALQWPLLAGDLTIYSAAAPRATLLQLLYALMAGSALIFPAMFYLFRVFKK